MTIELAIPRPRADVLAWWTDLPDDYRAQDPREEPHRIEVLARDRDGARVDLMTFWRLPLGLLARIPETLRLAPEGDGFTVDVHFPLGLRQRDVFTLRDDGRGGTRVTIELVMGARHPLAWVLVPLYWNLYARRVYPKTFATAGELCARDAPRRETNYPAEDP